MSVDLRQNRAVAKTGIVLMCMLAFFAGCEFERERRLPPAGLFGFLAQITTGASVVTGQYCGQTTPSDGAPGGYAAIKSLCVAACGSSTAPLCSAEELQFSAGEGLQAPSKSWYGSFRFGFTGTFNYYDCQGWTVNSGANNNGAVVLLTPSYSPSQEMCSNSNPFACCDFRVVSP